MTRRTKVRSATKSDLQQLVALYRHLHDDDVIPSDDQVEAAWNAIVTTRGMSVFVAEQEHALVASCVLSISPNLTRGCRPYGLIENVVTHQRHRRRGIGKKVVMYALQEAWRHGCYKVMLLTGRKDPGIHSFYASCGFVAGEKAAYVAKPQN